MIVRILDAAERDIEEGFRFYEKKLPALGSYFWIRSILILTLSHISEVSIVWFLAIIDFSANDSHLLYITE